MTTKFIEDWSYSNIVPAGNTYIDTDDLFLFARTLDKQVVLDHPVYYVKYLGVQDFYIDMNDGTCLILDVDEDPRPDVDKVLFRIPKNKVRFELKQLQIASPFLDAQPLLTNALLYNGSYTASNTLEGGKWGFYEKSKFIIFTKYDYTVDQECYMFDEFKPFVMYYKGLYIICYGRAQFSRVNL